MAQRGHRLAKLTRPAPAGLLVRERLFRLLDDAQRIGPFIHVAAPAGAGKTSLVTSWLERGAGEHAWYQIDEDDADPAGFFRHLAMLSRSSMPQITRPQLADPRAFARRFFTRFFARTTGGFTLVFDNCHLVPVASLLHELIAIAAQCAPERTLIMCISRELPPPPLARFCTDLRIAGIGWEELRVTDAEAIAMARGAQVDRTQAVELNARARGWAAGLRLLLQASRTEVDRRQGGEDSRQLLFNYFASEGFERSEPALRQLLLRTSLLSSFDATQATVLSDEPQAAKLLLRLHERQFFIACHAHEDGRRDYSYHPLFREFLHYRAKQALPTEAYRRLCLQSAALAIAAGDHQTAAGLYAEAEAWDELCALIVREAPTLEANGQLLTLAHRLAPVPAERYAHDPWLRFWHAQVHEVSNRVLSGHEREQAYQQFLGLGDAQGAMYCCGAALAAEVGAETNASNTLLWADRLHRHLLESAASRQVELRLLSQLQALAAVDPCHPLLVEFERRAIEQLATDSTPTEVLTLCTFVLMRSMVRGDSLATADLLARGHVAAHDPEIPAIARVPWLMWVGTHHWHRAEHALAATHYAQALAAADAVGIHGRDCQCWIMETFSALSAGDVSSAQQGLTQAQRLADVRSTLHMAQLDYLRAGIFMLTEEPRRALSAARAALKLHLQARTPFHAALNRQGLATILLELGEPAAARAEAALVREFAEQLHSSLLAYQAYLVEAQALHEEGRAAEGLAALELALRLGRDGDHLLPSHWWRPKSLAPLLARALNAGIETDYVCSVIRRRNVKAPYGLASERWPWPVRIRVLGHFTCEVDGELVNHGRPHGKPMELLQALLSRGHTRADVHQLIEDAWPESGDAMARNAFDITLHRLRRSLRHRDAIIVSDGELLLDGSQVWVDALAFEHWCDLLQSRLDGNADPAVLATELRDLYRGPFVPGDPSAHANVTRERLRGRFVRAAQVLARRLHERADGGEALGLLGAAVEVDPAAEELHRLLMRTLRELGRNGEALTAWGHCRSSLWELNSAEPSPATRDCIADLLPDTPR